MENIKREKGLVHTVCVLAVICMFGISAMMLGSVGASVYKNIAERNLNSFELRTSLSYVKTKINQYDEVGRIAVEERDGLKMLILSEEVQGEIFDTAVYFNKGKLYEITGARGMKFKPDDGFAILNVDSFDISENNGLIKLVTTDDGETETLYVKLRNS
ncbi:DUF4860 domain-containing protein [Catonella morbi]|nr:DUF4860 domain-containing protein [Catonella morbi]